MNALKYLPASRTWAKNPSKSECSCCKEIIPVGVRLIYADAFEADFCSQKCFHSYSMSRQVEGEWDRLAELQSGGQV